MSGRYLCFIRFARSDEAQSRPQPSAPMGFRAAMVTETLSLFVNGQLAFEPAGADGYAILGVAFPYDATRVRPAGPRALLESVWGMFVGLRAGPGGEISIVRDPSGQLPCFYRADGTDWIIASDLDLLRSADRQTFDIDWDEVADELLFPNHFSARTALAGVRELLAGEILVISGSRLRTEVAWSPWDHVGAPIGQRPESVARLRRSFAMVHEAITNRFPRPLITVSGGLDSSIVATQISLHTAGARHLTFYTPSDPLGDERSYARVVAEACAATLTEAPYVAADFATNCRSEMPLPRPTRRTIAGLMNARIADEAFLVGHDAILGGFGGDNIFHAGAAAYALGDRIDGGAGPRAILDTMRDLRKLTSASYIDLLRHGAKVSTRRCRRAKAVLWPRQPAFLRPAITDRNEPGNLHPWLTAPAGAASGSAAHVASLLASHVYLERMPRASGPAHIWPLLLAPIVETCLAIPSWLWCADGMDRSIARMAATELPPAIAARRSKGSPMAMHSRYFETHRDEIARFLCDGMLSERGIVDADAIRRYCERPPPVRDLDYLRILELTDAEIWCRSQAG
ncbi:asparagine synthase-related protein [Sphingobium sp. AN558]|uniref:asparagine synthase-related protein n=1 Tax=Sphingobium sp. AN558 TaxID=3133442 RepID=UPI0030BA49FC